MPAAPNTLTFAAAVAITCALGLDTVREPLADSEPLSPVRFLITGGAGYIGSLLTANLLMAGNHVVVVDNLLFGGDSLLAYMSNANFRFRKADVTADDLSADLREVDVVYHLAALVGFPVCQAVGEEVAYKFNRDATRLVFEAAERAGVSRFIFASTYSNYGIAEDSRPVTEESTLHPQSLYARTKIASEEFLLERGQRTRVAPVIPRFTTLFGVSPRTRFDLLVNQFVLEALLLRKLVLFQGNYRRSFVHVRDVVRALQLLATAPIDAVRNQIFNVGAEDGNYTKAAIIDLIRRNIDGVELEKRDLTFGSDMRDVAVSCRKIRERLGFEASTTPEDGIKEVRDAISWGLIKEPQSQRYRNHDLVIR
jgi:nucleoside-diphosphate-sugar epimerase